MFALFARNKGLTGAIVLVLGLIAGLLVYRAGYRSGVDAGAKSIAEAPSDETLTAEAAPTGESGLLRSRVIVRRDDHSVAKPSIAGLTRMVRFRSSSHPRLYSADSEGSDWKEDLTLGYPDGKKGDFELFKCPAETQNRLKYTFLTSAADCYGFSKSAKGTGTYVTRRLKDRLHLPVYLCVTPEKAFYPTLNHKCEDPTDTLRDLVGYFLTAEVVRQ